MNSDILGGKWKQLKGAVKQQWGKLTDDEIDQVNGNAEKLAGILQEKYGYSKAQADQEVHKFMNQHDMGDMNTSNRGTGF